MLTSRPCAVWLTVCPVPIGDALASAHMERIVQMQDSPCPLTLFRLARRKPAMLGGSNILPIGGAYASARFRRWM